MAQVATTLYPIVFQRCYFHSTVSATNGAPVAVADTADTDAGVAVVVDVLANDTDEDLDTLSIVSVTDPSSGTVSIVADGIEYTPADGFSGVDSFDYEIEDGNGGSATATVTITINAVNADPVALADAATTDAGTAVLIDVLVNDTDADEDELSIDALSTPANGTVELAGTSVEYTPAADFVGDDTFTYDVVDGNGGSATGEVTVTVLAANSDPIAVDDTIVISQDTADNIIDVLDNDSDADLDPLTILSITDPLNGTAVIAGATIAYTPDAGYVGDDSFDYTVDDGAGGSASATVLVTVESAAAAAI